MHNSSSFIKKDIVTDLFKNEIKNEIKRRNFDFSHEIFNPSHITECGRRILYRSRGEKQKIDSPSDIFLKIDIQEAIKNKWINFFEKTLSIKVVDKNVILVDCKYNLTGKADGILKTGDLLIVLMVKAVSSEEFVRISEKGSPRKHVIELMINMWLAEIKDGLLLYENKDSQEFCLYHVVPYNPILESSRKKCMQLLEHKIKGTIPSRPYDSMDDLECSICEFKSKCWEKKE